MHVVVVGAGIIGTLTAYYLGMQGFKVTVLERRDDIAAEASGANASQLCFKSLYSMGAPSVFPVLPKTVFGMNADLRIRDAYDPYFWSWGMAFLWHSLPRNHHRDTVKLLEMAAQSQGLYEELLEKYNLKFSYEKCGRIRLYETGEGLNHARRDFEKFDMAEGRDYRILSRDECITRTPALADIMQDIAGGLFTMEDGIGDTVKFCRGLRDAIARQERCDVTFATGANINNITADSDKGIQSLSVKGEAVKADRYVLCAGAETALMMRRLGHGLNMYPVKGCSLLVPYSGSYAKTDFPHSLAFMGQRVVLAPLEHGLRFSTGMVFDRYRQEELPELTRRLKDKIGSIFPRMELGDVPVYTGLRPVMPSSIPVAKRLGNSNTYVNTGHGMWGWTLGPVTCHRIAGMMAEEAKA